MSTFKSLRASTFLLAPRDADPSLVTESVLTRYPVGASTLVSTCCFLLALVLWNAQFE